MTRHTVSLSEILALTNVFAFKPSISPSCLKPVPPSRETSEVAELMPPTSFFSSQAILRSQLPFPNIAFIPSVASIVSTSSRLLPPPTAPPPAISFHLTTLLNLLSAIIVFCPSNIFIPTTSNPPLSALFKTLLKRSMRFTLRTRISFGRRSGNISAMRLTPTSLGTNRRQINLYVASLETPLINAGSFSSPAYIALRQLGLKFLAARLPPSNFSGPTLSFKAFLKPGLPFSTRAKHLPPSSSLPIIVASLPPNVKSFAMQSARSFSSPFTIFAAKSSELYLQRGTRALRSLFVLTSTPSIAGKGDRSALTRVPKGTSTLVKSRVKESGVMMTT
mmetsp:Transcript_9558/g.19456  ORF Transcript_9558/g.19456 Transcript_9558/m.19456 type:complete len:334 (+) Transcript_9558:621-1622(+)